MESPIKDFSEINLRRNDIIFRHPEGDPLYRAICICEEAGELAGAIKKLHRGFNIREYKKWSKKFLDESGITEFDWNNQTQTQKERSVEEYWLHKQRANVKSEAADLFIYLDLLASKMNFDLMDEVKKKFNQVSKEMNAEDFIIQ